MKARLLNGQFSGSRAGVESKQLTFIVAHGAADYRLVGD